MFLIAGPCAIESRETVMETARVLKAVCDELGVRLYFKSSFDKANRTSCGQQWRWALTGYSSRCIPTPTKPSLTPLIN